MPNQIHVAPNESTPNTFDALHSPLAALDAEFGVSAEQTPEDIAEGLAAREWREEMFAKYPMLTVEHIYQMSHRHMAKGHFKVAKGGIAND